MVSRSITPEDAVRAGAGVGLAAQDRGLGIVGAAQVDVGARVDDDGHALAVGALARRSHAGGGVLGVAQLLAVEHAVLQVAAHGARRDRARHRLPHVGRRRAVAALEVRGHRERDRASDAADRFEHPLAADHLTVGQPVRGRDRPRGGGDRAAARKGRDGPGARRVPDVDEDEDRRVGVQPAQLLRTGAQVFGRERAGHAPTLLAAACGLARQGVQQ
jgi:hypothetical protein